MNAVLCRDDVFVIRATVKKHNPVADETISSITVGPFTDNWTASDFITDVEQVVHYPAGLFADTEVIPFSNWDINDPLHSVYEVIEIDNRGHIAINPSLIE